MMMMSRKTEDELLQLFSLSMGRPKRLNGSACQFSAPFLLSFSLLSVCLSLAFSRQREKTFHNEKRKQQAYLFSLQFHTHTKTDAVRADRRHHHHHHHFALVFYHQRKQKKKLQHDIQ